MSKKIEIEIPSLEIQRMAVFENGIKESIDALRKNLEAAPYPKAASVDYSALDARYFMTIEQGWIAPPPANWLMPGLSSSRPRSPNTG